MREYYGNFDFDRTLRGGPSALEGPGFTFIHEMSAHYLFAGEASDSLVLHSPLPADFLEYIEGKRLGLPNLTLHPAVKPDAVFTPFGWNTHAEARNRLYRSTSPHPSLEAIRSANSRQFSRSLEMQGGVGVKGDMGGLFDSLEALRNFLSRYPLPLGWVAKANYGQAGTGNLRLLPGVFGEAESRAVEKLILENRYISLEPWHERIIDLAVNFEVSPDGGVRHLRGHTLLNSRDGTFLGISISPAKSGRPPGPPEPWREGLENQANKLASALRNIGYFGPVGMDAYVWKSPEGPKLRPMVDVNARLSMAMQAHGLARRLPDRHVRWEWMNPKKLHPEASYAELEKRLAPHAFDPASGNGILITSPMRMLSRARPRRLGVLFSGDGEEELIRLRAHFRNKLGKGFSP